MDNLQIERFVQNFNINMPRLFQRGSFKDAEITDETAILEYNLTDPIPVEDFLDELDDQMELILLYHVIPSDATLFGQKCCAYSNPVFDRMFKINGQSNDEGNIETIYVTLYDSLLTFGVEVRNELNEMTARFRVAFARPETDVLRDFIK